MSKRAWLWVVSVRSPDVRMHVSLTGVTVAVEHGQDVRHVAFSSSFLSLYLLCPRPSSDPSLTVSGVSVCVLVFLGAVHGLVCVFLLL